MDDFDEYGNFIGNEYSSSGSSESEMEALSPEPPQQSIDEPLVKIPVKNQIEYEPENKFHNFLLQQNKTKNIVFYGHMFHGKSSICGLFAELPSNLRKTTLNLDVYCVLVPNLDGKSHAVNLVDTPGHPDFEFELKNITQFGFGRCLVVDVCEGMVIPSPIVPNLVIINKIDRLILEMRLPPKHATLRIFKLIKEITDKYGNVNFVFMSSKFRFAFTFESMQKLYLEFQNLELDLSTPANFAKFVLQPIYKLFSAALLGLNAKTELESVGVHLSKAEFDLSMDDRITLVMERFLMEPLNPLTNGLILAGSGVSLGGLRHLWYDDLAYTLSGGPFDSKCLVPCGDKLFTTNSVAENALCLTLNTPLNKQVLQTPVIWVGIEPLQDRPEYFEEIKFALDKLKQKYLLETSQLITGEYTLFGSGELMLDVALRDLKTWLDFQISVSQPLPILLETVNSESSIAFPTRSQSNLIVITASNETNNEDAIVAEFGTNKLFSKVDLGPSKEFIIEGFKMCCRNGPLTESTLDKVNFTISEFEAGDVNFELAILTQRACTASFLVAKPALLEPMAFVYTVGKVVVGKALYKEMEKRQGLITVDTPIHGTNLYFTCGEIPVLDCFGIQVDVEMHLESVDTGYCLAKFNGEFKQVSGDVLGNTKPVRLRPANTEERAKDLMVKVRRRRGLSDEPVLGEYLDEDVRELME